jgi:hypothetical protein
MPYFEVRNQFLQYHALMEIKSTPDKHLQQKNLPIPALGFSFGNGLALFSQNLEIAASRGILSSPPKRPSKEIFVPVYSNIK